MNDLELLDDLLAHPSTWAEAPPDLEDVVVWAVADAAAPMATSSACPTDGGASRRCSRSQRCWRSPWSSARWS